MNLQLISDKAALFFLAQFSNVPKEVEETKHLIERKIAGDNPTDDEWKGNANNYAFAFANAFTNVSAYTFAFVNAFAFTFAFAFANANANANAKAFAKAYVKARVFDYYATALAKTTADYIIGLLDGYKGEELEEYFGPWMATAIINKISTPPT